MGELTLVMWRASWQLRLVELPIRGANDASRVRVQLSSSRVVNISSQARARVRVELKFTQVEF